MDKRENELVKKASLGNHQAFASLVSLYSKKIYNFCYRMLQEKEDTRDATQETFIRVWKNLPQYDNSRKPFISWMLTIAAHICIDWLRKRQKENNLYPLHSTLSQEKSPPNAFPSPEEEFIYSEEKEILLLFMQQLPPLQKAIFSLCDIDGFSPDEVMEILHLSKDQIKSNRYHAKQKLKRQIKKHYER